MPSFVHPPLENDLSDEQRAQGRQPQIYHSKRVIKSVKEGKLVESANTLAYQDFFRRYDTQLDLRKAVSDRLSNSIDVRMVQANALTLRGSFLDDCLHLIEETSGEDYHVAETRWSLVKKRKEMMLPDLRYILFYEGASSAVSDRKYHQLLRGFISFMITYEDGHEVIYIYEIHLKPDWQGKGIGALLMSAIEDIGRRVGVEKSMLTVFRSNQNAIMFYNKLGYVEDEFSPGPRKLRNGTTKEPSYVILSKTLTVVG